MRTAVDLQYESGIFATIFAATFAKSAKDVGVT